MLQDSGVSTRRPPSPSSASTLSVLRDRAGSDEGSMTGSITGSLTGSMDGSLAHVLDPWGDRVTPQALAFVDDPETPGRGTAEYRRDLGAPGGVLSPSSGGRAAGEVYRSGGAFVCSVCALPVGRESDTGTASYWQSPDGTVRHAACIPMCTRCRIQCRQPLYRRGVPGVFCSAACIDECDPSVPRCYVCSGVVTGRYSVLPDGRCRHPSCPVTCDKAGCGRVTTQPVFFKDIPGTFCSKACGLENDPDALRCSVCFAVFTGGEHAVAPDGARRHMMCAVPCDACGTKTTRPLYFKGFGGAYCSNACGKRSDPASIPCYVCGRVISGPYTIESAGSKVGCRKHPHCFPSRRQMAAGGRK